MIVNTQKSSASHFLDQEAQAQAAIRAIRNGYPVAFDQLVHLYTPRLFSLCRGMLGNDSEAEESVQEIFLLVFRSLDRYQLTTRFFPWFYSIALNHLRSCLRRRKRRQILTIQCFSPDLGPDSFPTCLPGPEDLVISNEAQNMIASAIENLKPIQRAIFLLRRIDGLSVKETANILKLPEGSVKTHLHRAISKLRQEILGSPVADNTVEVKLVPRSSVNSQ